MKKVFLVIVFCVVFIIAGAVQISADTFLPPQSFVIRSRGGTKVFRWTPSESGVAQACVYRNRRLIYTVDDLPSLGVSADNFTLSRDFQHFVFRPTTGHEIALQFYAYGELIKTHYVRDLVEDMSRVTHTASMAWWHRRIPGEMLRNSQIARNNIFRIMTIEDVIFEFDLTTGEILSRSTYRSPWPRYGLFAGVGTIVVGIIVIIAVKRKKRGGA